MADLFGLPVSPTNLTLILFFSLDLLFW